MCDENISFLIDETTDETDGLIEKFDFSFVDYGDDNMPQIINYQLNFTMRQLTQICDFYEIQKTKKNKDELIKLLVDIETNLDNCDVVCRRKLLWFYMDEIKNDKYMKKFVLLW